MLSPTTPRNHFPVGRGRRITVRDDFEYLVGGMTEDQILEDFPELTREDIDACFAFAADRERKLFVAPA
ncbi:MAG TPA: DUF433 domain-containing protein [Chthoniobacterales bacterium]|nr:DUF433 domain-containing protein [Chthoniobacterales bacterium]